MPQSPSVPLLLAQSDPNGARTDSSLVAPLQESFDPTRYLFDNPWPLAGLLVAVAVGLVWWFNRQGKAKEGVRWAALCGALAAAAVLTGRLVTTQREVLMAQTRQLISVTAKADLVVLEPLLAREIVLTLPGNSAAFSRGQILDLVRKYPGGQYPVESVSIDSVQAVLDGPSIANAQVHVRTSAPEATLYDFPVGSWWKIGWRRDGDRWVVSSLQCLQIDGVSPGTSVSP